MGKEGSACSVPENVCPVSSNKQVKQQVIPSRNKEGREQRDGWSSGCAWLVCQAVLELHGCFVCVIQMTYPRASLRLAQACHEVNNGTQGVRKSPADQSNHRQVKLKSSRFLFFVFCKNRLRSKQNASVKLGNHSHRTTPEVFVMFLNGSVDYSLAHLNSVQ